MTDMIRIVEPIELKENLKELIEDIKRIQEF